ncbi:MAG: hypothetical protein V3W37_02405 [Candidatus Binatia bacterium]
MTLEELLKKVGKLDREATDGPWAWYDRETDALRQPGELLGFSLRTTWQEKCKYGGTLPRFIISEEGPDDRNGDANADFIAFARTAMPDLASRLRKAEAGLRAANANREHVDKYHGYDGGRCPSSCPAKIVQDTLREIEEPLKQ